jgi:probable HAF family extracellular repeat protein
MMSTLKRLSCLVAAPALLLASLAAHADPRYTVTPIGTVAGGYSIPFGINEAGQVTGSSYTGDGKPDYAFLYSGNTLSNIGSLGGSSHGININGAGQIVGNSAVGAASHAFLYSGGALTDLGTLGGQNSSANGINDAGLIAGAADLSNGNSHAFLYSGGQMRDLGTLGGRTSTASEINNGGLVTGWSDVSGGFVHAFVFANDAMTDLGTLAGQNNYSQAYAINNQGHVVGSSGFEESAFTHAFVYANGKMTDLGTALGVSSDAFGINDLGQVVGRAYYGPGGGLRGFLYADGVATDLNDLIDPASGWTIVEGSDINNNGQIVAYGFKAGYGTQALRLDPITSAVPEPAALGMLLMGLSTLAFVLPGFERHRYSSGAGRKPTGVASVDWAYGVFARLGSLLVAGLLGPQAGAPQRVRAAQAGERFDG